MSFTFLTFAALLLLAPSGHATSQSQSGSLACSRAEICSDVGFCQNTNGQCVWDSSITCSSSAGLAYKNAVANVLKCGVSDSMCVECAKEATELLAATLALYNFDHVNSSTVDELIAVFSSQKVSLGQTVICAEQAALASDALQIILQQQNAEKLHPTHLQTCSFSEADIDAALQIILNQIDTIGSPEISSAASGLADSLLLLGLVATTMVL